MMRIRQKYGLLIIGIVLGAAYGLLTRLVFGEQATLASITYLFIIPTVLGMVPLMLASSDQLRSYRNIIFIPWLTVATFFFTLFLVGLEDSICLLILAAPFFILGTLGAFIYRLIQLRRQKRKGQLLSLLLLPFVLAPAEALLKSPSEAFDVTSEVNIAASPDMIWNNIIEVKPIQADEYTAGWFNQLGIPRPIQANVDKRGVGGQRTGNFEGGLKFVEHINRYEPCRKVSFSIVIDPTSVRKRVFDQHVLNGNYFTFVDAAYTLEALPNGNVTLQLSSRYRLTSKINLYGKRWGNIMLKDFQDRLLAVIKNRCEGKYPASKTTLPF